MTGHRSLHSLCHRYHLSHYHMCLLLRSQLYKQTDQSEKFVRQAFIVVAVWSQ